MQFQDDSHSITAEAATLIISVSDKNVFHTHRGGLFPGLTDSVRI